MRHRVPHTFHHRYVTSARQIYREGFVQQASFLLTMNLKFEKLDALLLNLLLCGYRPVSLMEGSLLRIPCAILLPDTCNNSRDQNQKYRCQTRDEGPAPAGKLLELVNRARWSRRDWLVCQVGRY